MAFKKMVEWLTKPIDKIDRQELSQYCDLHQFQAMDHLAPRQSVQVGGEVRAVRIVPRAGAPALEVTLSDGRGQVVAVFLGRRKIAGLSPGRRVAVRGVIANDGNRSIVFNPVYEILS